VTELVFFNAPLSPCVQWNVENCNAVLNEDKSETEQFKDVWNHLMTKCINYDLSRAKLVSSYLFSQYSLFFL
jgi:hypothetical protein